MLYDRMRAPLEAARKGGTQRRPQRQAT
jgi:hypothetical protein